MSDKYVECVKQKNEAWRKINELDSKLNSKEGKRLPYDAVLDRAYTVAKFIETVLQRKDEWVYIMIRQRPPVSWFDYPRCEYRCGELLSKLPDVYLDQPVILAEADGGWTRMDYILYV